MHDYQLERLNTRSFEQLVQALALEVIGKQVTIFGDGPDGGREATFEGPVKYPEGQNPWNGFGIVQAKFRQEPDPSQKENANWAIAQLRAEFNKLKPRQIGKSGSVRGSRTCPDYYIFATNLKLSSVEKVGGKDRIREVLDGLKVSHGLKDYAIWDGTQIRRFLDSNTGVRMTYAAWLLPGDVLTAMLQHLELHTTDFSSTIRRYLESELLDDQFAKLGQGGYTDANSIPLANVFMDLPLEAGSVLGAYRHYELGRSLSDLTSADGVEDSSKPTFLEEFFEEGRQVLRPSANVNRPSSISPRSNSAGRVVLIGGPGQGKTTVGLFACQLLRVALLQAGKVNRSPEVDQALLRIAEHAEHLPPVHVLRYPLRVDLKKFAEAIAGEGDLAANSLLDYLVLHIRKRTDSELSKQEFRLWLKSYPWLLVLDGLDEVPASSNRAKVTDAVRDFISIEAHQLDADLLVLGTTRPQGYSEEFSPAFYSHVTLAPLSPVEALKYGSKLAGARHPGLKTRIEELIRSLRQATTNAATVRLMESPLQVTIMLALIEGGGQPPEQRWKLFHDYYDVIYRREKERGTPFSLVLSRYEPDIHWLHHRAAWILQQQNARPGRTAARLSHSDFEKIVENRLLSRGHTDHGGRGALVSQICAAATDRLVFLVGNTVDEVGFEIRSLQEFMAAEHCFDGSELSVQNSVRCIAPSSYWRNVFLFVAGRIFFEKESLIDTLVAVCERLNEPLNDPAQGALLGGSHLALAMLTDGAVRNQPENTRVLARCAARLFDGQHLEELERFLILFRSEAADVLKEELLKRLDPAGLPHLPWNLCLMLAGTDCEWATKVLNTRFPWSHGEISNFLNLTVPNWDLVPAQFWQRIKENIYAHSPLMWFSRLQNPNIPDFLDFKPLTELHLIFFHPDSGSRTRVLYEAGEDTPVSLYQRSDMLLCWAALVIKTTDVDNVHPDWQYFHKVSEFARAATPENLATLLAFSFDFNPSKAIWGVLPWQVRAGLLAKESGIGASDVVSAVANSSLGGPANWAIWDNCEEIKLSSLGYPDGMLSASDDQRGLIYSSRGWTHSGGPNEQELEFAAAVTEALPKLLPGSAVAETLVDVCSFGLNNPTAGLRPGDELVLRGLIQTCQACGLLLRREILAAVVRSSISIDIKLELIVAMGIKVGGRSLFPNWGGQAMEISNGCEAILNAAEQSGFTRVVLTAFSMLPPLPFAKTLPARMLASYLNGDEAGRQAAIVLRLNSLQWSVEEAREMAMAAMALKEPYENYLSELTEFVESEGEQGPHLEAFFLAILGALALRQDVGFLQRIGSLLVKLVDRRPAANNLPDPEVRNPKP